MPIVKIEYDNTKVSDKEIVKLAEAAQKIVSAATLHEDVCVYANSARIKVGIYPIEIFVQIGTHKITDPDKLLSDVKSALSEWKSNNNFQSPINLTIMPMVWKLEMGI